VARRTETPRMTGHDDDVVLDLIADNAAAWARFGRAVALVDEDKAKADGRKITPADQAEYDAANEAERKTFRALLAFPTLHFVAARTKVAWIQLHLSLGDHLEHEEVDLLLGSMATRVE